MAMLLSGALGAGGAVVYNQYAPAQMLFGQVHTDLATLHADMQELIGNSMSDKLTPTDVILSEIHQVLLRQENKEDAARAQVQARVNRIQNDAAQLKQAMPR